MASCNRDYASGALYIMKYFRKVFVNLLIRRCKGRFSIYGEIQYSYLCSQHLDTTLVINTLAAIH